METARVYTGGEKEGRGRQEDKFSFPPPSLFHILHLNRYSRNLSVFEREEWTLNGN